MVFVKREKIIEEENIPETIEVPEDNIGNKKPPKYNWMTCPKGAMDCRGLDQFTDKSYLTRFNTFVDAGYKLKEMSALDSANLLFVFEK